MTTVFYQSFLQIGLMMALCLPALAQSPVNFESVLVKQGILRDGLPGLELHVRLTLREVKGTKCDLNAYFYGADGKLLQDADGNYRAPDNSVSTNSKFVVNSDYDLVDTSTNPGHIVFLPYDQLHLGSGVHHLSLQMQVFDSSTNLLLGSSNFATFTYTKP